MVLWQSEGIRFLNVMKAKSRLLQLDDEKVTIRQTLPPKTQSDFFVINRRRGDFT